MRDAYNQVDHDYNKDRNHGYPCEVVRQGKPSPVYLDEKPKEHYYRKGGIEVIDFIKAKLTPEQYKGYLLGNIYKYSGRCQWKGEYQKDIIKLAQYTNWLLKEEDGRAAMKEDYGFDS